MELLGSSLLYSTQRGELLESTNPKLIYDSSYFLFFVFETVQLDVVASSSGSVHFGRSKKRQLVPTEGPGAAPRCCSSAALQPLAPFKSCTKLTRLYIEYGYRTMMSCVTGRCASGLDNSTSQARLATLRGREVNMLSIKVEGDDEGAVVKQEPGIEYNQLWPYSTARPDVHFAEVCGSFLDMKDEFDKTTVKEELEIGPTMLQSRAVPPPVVGYNVPMAIKVEPIGEDSVTTEKSETGQARLWKDSVTAGSPLVNKIGTRRRLYFWKTISDPEFSGGIESHSTVLSTRLPIIRSVNSEGPIVLYRNASVSEGGGTTERANNLSAHRCDMYFAMPKKVTERPRRSRGVKNVLKVRKVAKTGAQRIREYRARIRALENAAVARSAPTVEGIAAQIAPQQNLEDSGVDMCQNHHSLLYKALSRQRSRDEQEVRDNHQQFIDQVDVHQQHLLLHSGVPSTSTKQTQNSTQKITVIRRHSKIAKTPAERSRAYRERKKALKNATNQQVMIGTTL
ncbi:hypothetical protein EVAR_60680_1 [Eumeta japonica]|uniref:Uncharacterized protein n=1 Tax=Eumeta variegata TaxID=151549 RepID=A0A4C1ZTB9_EUMVA|nr:hypothetical protein EVAR_60680_1 [Eumeta japonica]